LIEQGHEGSSVKGRNGEVNRTLRGRGTKQPFNIQPSSGKWKDKETAREKGKFEDRKEGALK